jgi:hypothetical protein
VKIKLPAKFSRLLSPKFKPQFKSKSDVIKDEEFNRRLTENLREWNMIRELGVDVLVWWELLLKPGMRKLLIECGKEIKQERLGFLNLLQLRQSYLVRKIQMGSLEKLGELKEVQNNIQLWHSQECEKVKLQSRSEEHISSEKVCIYHHAKHIKKSSILKLQTENGTLEGHEACTKFLEKIVSDLLTRPAELDDAQELLLKEGKTVVSDSDNMMFKKMPDKEEVKESVWSANANAAPGTDGLTTFPYKHCWDTLGDSLTDISQAIFSGASPTLFQRTSLMVYGAKNNKPPNSTDPNHKRRITSRKVERLTNQGGPSCTIHCYL